MSPPVGESDGPTPGGTPRLGNRSSPLGDLSVDRIRSLSARPGREVVLGVLLAVGVAVVQILGLYVLLIIRWAVGAADAPAIGGLVAFVAATAGRCSQTFRLCPRFSV